MSDGWWVIIDECWVIDKNGQWVMSYNCWVIDDV